MSKDLRTYDELKHHYQVEILLADKLRHASKAERITLYTKVYNELYRQVPTHPLLLRSGSEKDSMANVRSQLRFLDRFLTSDTVFLELGAGDCALSIEVAKRVKTAYAIDISDATVLGVTWPENAKLLISDGTSIPVPMGSVTLAYSNQLMEHLHPDDALDQLTSIHRALKPGGRYICTTPNGLNGPHDISKYFDQKAKGLHMKEYTFCELDTTFRKAGFEKVLKYIGGKGFFIRMSGPLARTFETVFGTLPFRARHMVGNQFPCNAILALRLVAIK
jgi:SAM-dependent methyltransferase